MSQGKMRTNASKLLVLPFILSTAFMFWKSITLITNSPTPVVIVISESMSPAFHRGDLLFLSNWQQDVRVGDIPVCWFPGAEFPMVHRAVNTFYVKNVDGEDTYAFSTLNISASG